MTVVAIAELEDALASFRRTAFRAELRGRYMESGDPVAAFVAGRPADPYDEPGVREWDDAVRRLTAAGRRVERVRVHDDQPTDYQRWLRWASAGAVEAGEVIRYVSRPDAQRAGLDVTGDDWWLLDDERLYVLRFDSDDDGLVGVERVGDPERVARACAWRDVAVRLAAPDTAGVPS